MKTSEIRIDLGAAKMAAYLAVPDGAGPHPVVVVAHHRDGIDKFTRRTCERLAENGFASVAPNLYHRRPADEPSIESVKTLDDVETVADLNATVAYLQGQKSFRADAIGIMGHCMGGRYAFLGAATNPAIKAAGVFYGGSILLPRGKTAPPPITLTKNIKCAIAGYFGRDDKNPSPEDVATISAELTKYGIRHDFRIYDGAGHAFQNFEGERYREEQSEDAWRRVIPFLRAEL